VLGEGCGLCYSWSQVWAHVGGFFFRFSTKSGHSSSVTGDQQTPITAHHPLTPSSLTAPSQPSCEPCAGPQLQLPSWPVLPVLLSWLGLGSWSHTLEFLPTSGGTPSGLPV
jgi:hypothetical protein